MSQIVEIYDSHVMQAKELHDVIHGQQAPLATRLVVAVGRRVVSRYDPSKAYAEDLANPVPGYLRPPDCEVSCVEAANARKKHVLQRKQQYD